MKDSEDPCKSPWVWTSFLGVVNKNILLIKGDVNDILILLDVVCHKVDSHDRMLVEDAVLNNEIVITVVVVKQIRLMQPCIEVLFEVGEEVLYCRISACGQFLYWVNIRVPSEWGHLRG